MTIQRALVPATAILGILVTGWTVNGVNAQQQPMCLHAAGETPADAVRRADALRLVRGVNTAQAQAFAKTRTYRNFRELTTAGLPARAAGLSTQLTVEGSTYALVVKDTADPCRYTLFSDQDGLIYVGAPLR